MNDKVCCVKLRQTCVCVLQRLKEATVHRHQAFQAFIRGKPQ